MTKEEFIGGPTEGQMQIDDKAELWARYLELREASRTFKKWHARFKEIFGDADEITIGGDVVATHTVSGAVNQSQLKADHPELFALFEGVELVRVFDSAKFEAEHPTLAAAYRSRSLRIKN